MKFFAGLLLIFVLPAHAFCQENSAPKAQWSLFVVTDQNALLFDSQAFFNWVGALQPGHILGICDKNEKFLRTCPSGNLPSYFLKPETKLEPVRSRRLPALAKIFADKDYIDFIFNGTKAAPAVIVNPNSENLQFTFMNTQHRLEYTRYNHTWKLPKVSLTAIGDSAVSFSIPYKPKCGIRFGAPVPGVLRLEFKACPQKDFLIALDAGHGGSDTGTCNQGTCESGLTLQLAGKLQKALKGKGLDSFLIRTDDTPVPLQDRVATAREKQASLLVSLHFDNWQPSNYLLKAPSGSACFFFMEFLSMPAEMICKSKGLAKLPLHALFQRGLYVLHSYEIPSVLIEVANLGHKEDFALVMKEGFLDSAARDLAERLQAVSKEMSKR